MNNKNLIITSIFTAILLVGCGEGNTKTSNTEVSGNVADGYLVGAKVCLDINNNLMCDPNEPSVITGKNGFYTLSNLTPAQLEKYSIIAEITPNVIDEDTNTTVNKNYTLSALPKTTFISPISTIVRNDSVQNNLTKDQAKTDIANKLGISKNKLEEDYIKKSNQDLHKLAQTVADLKSKLYGDLDSNITGSYEYRFINTYIENLIGNELSTLANDIKTTKVDPTTLADNYEAKINMTNSKSAIRKIHDTFYKINNDENKSVDSNVTTSKNNFNNKCNVKPENKDLTLNADHYIDDITNSIDNNNVKLSKAKIIYAEEGDCVSNTIDITKIGVARFSYGGDNNNSRINSLGILISWNGFDYYDGTKNLPIVKEITLSMYIDEDNNPNTGVKVQGSRGEVIGADYVIRYSNSTALETKMKQVVYNNVPSYYFKVKENNEFRQAGASNDSYNENIRFGFDGDVKSLPKGKYKMVTKIDMFKTRYNTLVGLYNTYDDKDYVDYIKAESDSTPVITVDAF